MTRFVDFMTFLDELEGRISNHKADRGKLTNRGVTQKLYDACRVKWGKSKQSVIHMTETEQFTIYKEEFYEPLECERLPYVIGLAVFICGVNVSPKRAATWLQQELDNVFPDGDIGLKTLTAVGRTKPIHVALGIVAWCSQHYENLQRGDPTQKAFDDGWENRLAKLATKILKYDA